MSVPKRPGGRKPPVGPSFEVLAHALEVHERVCVRPTPDPLHTHDCPCGRSFRLHCGCGEPLFVGLKPGAEPCSHARELVSLP